MKKLDKYNLNKRSEFKFDFYISRKRGRGRCEKKISVEWNEEK